MKITCGAKLIYPRKNRGQYKKERDSVDFSVECEYRNSPKKYAKDRLCDDGLLIKHESGGYSLKCKQCIYLPDDVRKHFNWQEPKKERDSEWKNLNKF